jgi:ubiquitin-small subunit ribosomal protein S27Ae
MSQKEKAAAKAAPAPAPAPAPAAGAPPAAPGAEAVEAPKVRKVRKERKPRANVQVWKLYKVSGETAERLKKECPRCGKGYFMAEHKDRLSCGNCGYTTFKSKN